jgi:hypothetical protein
VTRTVALYILAVVFLAVNTVDVVTTWLGVSSGKAVEANPIVLLLGGPFSPAALFVKLALIPTAILGVTWWLAHRMKDPRLGMAALITPAIIFGTAVANNVIVIAKKVKKIGKDIR